MAYTKKTWADGKDGGTPVSAAELNRMEDGIAAGQNAAAPTADNLSGVTDTGKKVMKAADAKAARDAIGAGTGNGSSNLKVGPAATDAAAGNHTHSFNDLTDKPTIPSVSGLAKQSDLTAAVARITALEGAATPPPEG
ncbi:hypothetical protein NQ036_06795 [Brevibacterium sp. 91QC2O2]|uniref:hypothetical protein n=1 Tax=Brevibacterium sp. 91QC2O2 TaxID=2968458 RepID=UPI00211CA856|nr:hypothetical protein [Brevibacterium sp. 91QC2O2]MCQ9367951.1 hypothetical protein [Brevibacterium sp. 91QC2O2]